jgi:hypothetical protein
VDEVQDGGGDEQRDTGLLAVDPVLIRGHGVILLRAAWYAEPRDVRPSFFESRQLALPRHGLAPEASKEPIPTPSDCQAEAMLISTSPSWL